MNYHNTDHQAKQAAQYSQSQANQILGASTMDTIATPKENAIPMAVNNLERDLNMLTEIAHRLVSKIQPVMRPSEPSKENETLSRGSDVPFVLMIAEADNRVRTVMRLLQDAADRIEL